MNSHCPRTSWPPPPATHSCECEYFALSAAASSWDVGGPICFTARPCISAGQKPLCACFLGRTWRPAGWRWNGRHLSCWGLVLICPTSSSLLVFLPVIMLNRTPLIARLPACPTLHGLTAHSCAWRRREEHPFPGHESRQGPRSPCL